MKNNKNTIIVNSLELGLEIVVSLLLFILVGIYCDNKFDISPIGVIVGVFLGIASTFAILYRFGVKNK